MLSPNKLFQEQVTPIWGAGPVAPSSTTPDTINMKNVARLYAVISVLNGTTVTGSAISLKQAVNVANGSEKALAFSYVYQNIDCAAAQTLTNTAVASNTFTTDNTNSKALLYVIDIRPEMLDSDGGFDCCRVATGNATNATVSVMYYAVPKYTVNGQGPSMIVD